MGRAVILTGGSASLTAYLQNCRIRNRAPDWGIDRRWRVRLLQRAGREAFRGGSCGQGDAGQPHWEDLSHTRPAAASSSHKTCDGLDEIAGMSALLLGSCERFPVLRKNRKRNSIGERGADGEKGRCQHRWGFFGKKDCCDTWDTIQRKEEDNRMAMAETGCSFLFLHSPCHIDTFFHPLHGESKSLCKKKDCCDTWDTIQRKEEDWLE